MRRARRFAPAMALLLVLVGAACADDGASPFAPGADITGSWVRVEPFELSYSSFYPPVQDTLVLRSDGTGRWSTTLANAGAPLPMRLEQHVWFEPSGLRLHLWALPEPCDACRLTDPRLAPANWLLVRKSEDVIELRTLLDPSLEGLDGDARPGADVYRYRRIGAP